MPQYSYKVKAGSKGLIPTSGLPYGKRPKSWLKEAYEKGNVIHRNHIEKVEVKKKTKEETKE